MGGAKHFVALAEVIRTRFGGVFSRLELRPAGLIKAPKDVQHELSAQMLQEFDALTVEDRSGLSKLTSFIQKHRV